MAKQDENKAITPEEKEKLLDEKLAEADEKLALLDKKLAALESENNKKQVTNESPYNGPLRDISRHRDDDYVEVRVFKDGGKYKDDMFVGVNGVMNQIRRGVPVKVKRSYARIIGASEIDSARVMSEMSASDGNFKNITQD